MSGRQVPWSRTGAVTGRRVRASLTGPSGGGGGILGGVPARARGGGRATGLLRDVATHTEHVVVALVVQRGTERRFGLRR